MKKFLVGLLVFFLVGLVVVYFIIPQHIKVSTIAVIKENERAVYRSLTNEKDWGKWWPGDNGEHSRKGKSSYELNRFTYNIGVKQLDGIEVIINDKNSSTSSVINPSTLSTDSMMINWSATLTSSANPVAKISTYFEARALRQSMEQVLAHFKAFAEKEENLYGINIIETRVTDTILMVIKKIQKEKPGDAEIYTNIDLLKKYIAGSNAHETNHPMLNVRFLDEQKSFELIVAIPIDKHLKGTETITWKRMIPGKILYTEVKGGEATVEQAMRQMDNYVFDNQKVSPALAYQLLITDRMNEKDTAKWVTRIYYPVL